MSDFAKLCENPRVMALMAQIEKNILAAGEQEQRLYRCPTCLDLGIHVAVEESRLGDHVPIAYPCQDCTVGARVERQRSRDRFRGHRNEIAANRRLTDVERQLILCGEYSFLDVEAT